MKTIRDVIDRWESAEVLAGELGQKGVTVRAWRNRGAIPPRYWLNLVEAARRRGFPDVTLELLAQIHASPAGRLSEAEPIGSAAEGAAA